MLRGVHLYGRLGEEFGPHHRFDIDSVGEAVRALGTQYRGFYPALREGSYQVIRGADLDGEPMSLEMLGLNLGAHDLHLVPVIEGAKSGNGKAIITAVIGIALVATGVGMGIAGMQAGMSFGAAMGATAFTLPAGLGAVTFAQIALFGAALALGGIWQLVAPTPTMSGYDSAEDQQVSFIFNGAINRMEQGGALQIVYGRYRVGSTVISAGIDVNALLSPDTTYNVSITGDAHITPSPVGTVAIQYNRSLTIRCSVVNGYTVNTFLVDGAATSDYRVIRDWQGYVSEVSYTLYNIKGAHTIAITSRAMLPSEYPVITEPGDPGR